ELLAEAAGDEDERQIGARARCELQRGKSVERRKLVVRENKVDLGCFQRGDELGTRLDAPCCKDESVRFKEPLNQIGITGIVLQQQQLERRVQRHLFMLPGGGSLITAQNAPNSLMAFTNS